MRTLMGCSWSDVEGFEMKRLLQRVDEPVKLINPAEKPEEKSAEIVYVLLGMTALYYGLGLMVLLQGWLVLDGVRNQSEYSILTSKP